MQQSPSSKFQLFPRLTQDSKKRQPDFRHRVLIVDDNRAFLEPVATALCNEGYIVRATQHGDDLLRLVTMLDPAVLITDVIMPETDVLDIIPTLRETRPQLKIIAISGNPHLLTLASKKGANHILAKPFQLEQLSLLIRVTMQ